MVLTSQNELGTPNCVRDERSFAPGPDTTGNDPGESIAPLIEAPKPRHNARARNVLISLFLPNSQNPSSQRNPNRLAQNAMFASFSHY